MIKVVISMLSIAKAQFFSFDTEVSEFLVIELIYYEANKNEDNYSVL